MIAAWMLYSLLVGVFVSGGAMVLEVLLRAHRRPTRWVWTGALGLSALWPLVHVLRGLLPQDTGAIPVPDPSRIPVLDPLTVQVTQDSFLRSLDGPIMAVWALSSAALVAGFVLLAIRTRRQRRLWRGERAGGHEVLFSQNLGPAVVGYVRPEIVLPDWCKELESHTLSLILDHELEHLRAGDLRLTLTAGIIPILFPWHFPIWWQYRRLRLAVEGDCDLRVLRKHPERTRPYMELLLQVGRHPASTSALVATLSEPEEALERRIRIMTMPFPKKPWIRAAALTTIVGALIAAACWAPSPKEAPPEQTEVAPTEISIPPTPQQISAREAVPTVAEAQGSGTATLAPSTVSREAQEQDGTVSITVVEQEAGKETPGQALEHFFHVTARYVKDWVDGILDRGPNGEEAGTEAFAVTNPVQASATGQHISAEPTFTPYTVRPDIKNRAEIARALEREYPPLLQDAGIGGTVQIWFFIDRTGQVKNLKIDESSGHQALDEAALRVAESIQFTPAMNRDEAVPVWISLPITFQVPEEEGGVAEGRGWPEPPGPEAAQDVAAAPTFTPYTVRPDIENRAEVAQALERQYPPLLRDAGIGGTAQVWFFIDAQGRVGNVQINKSSGHQALDEAALAVAEMIQFTPAMNRDEAVPVWISLPITFTVR